MPKVTKYNFELLPLYFISVVTSNLWFDESVKYSYHCAMFI